MCVCACVCVVGSENEVGLQSKSAGAHLLLGGIPQYGPLFKTFYSLCLSGQYSPTWLTRRYSLAIAVGPR